MRLIDVSPALSHDSVTWPGDHPFTMHPTWQIRDGASVNVSRVETTTHIGAHIDAPLHVREGAADISQIPLESCIGDALVVDVSDLVDRSTLPHRAAPAEAVIARIENMLAGEPGSCPAVTKPLPGRLLMKHHAQRPEGWDHETPGIDPPLIHWCTSRGVQLIGVDLDSFDVETSKSLPAHQAAIDGDIVILEGLDLSQATPGRTELIALPIAWQGADAAPVRAILRYF